MSIAVARSRHWQITSARNCAGISSTSPPSHASQDAVKLRGDAVPFFASGPTPLSIPATPSTLRPRRPPLCLRGELLVLVDPFSLSFAFRIIVLVLVVRAVPRRRRSPLPPMPFPATSHRSATILWSFPSVPSFPHHSAHARVLDPALSRLPSPENSASPRCPPFETCPWP